MTEGDEPGIETTLRRADELGLVGGLTAFRMADGRWQAGMARRGDHNSFRMGYGGTLIEAILDAVSPPHGTSLPDWLRLDECGSDDWKDLI